MQFYLYNNTGINSDVFFQYWAFPDCICIEELLSYPNNSLVLRNYLVYLVYMDSQLAAELDISLNHKNDDIK